ncbi:hypothetical protein [Mesorhizobium sp. CAU 1741]|uniref:hypothetical protein n=1 Tax=Mesorhizobium sp. CAU 1741 TaxID=3140366 RepID=UPI00325BBAE2
MIRFVCLLLASMLTFASGASNALAADPVAVRLGDTGVCASDKVLNRITKRFDYQVRNVPHLPQVAIDGFHRIHEVRHLPRRPDWPIDRLYCQAKAALSDGRSRDIYYLIEWPMGFAGIGGNVEFCVSGFDSWHVYGGRCRSLR